MDWIDVALTLHFAMDRKLDPRPGTFIRYTGPFGRLRRLQENVSPPSDAGPYRKGAAEITQRRVDPHILQLNAIIFCNYFLHSFFPRILLNVQMCEEAEMHMK